MSATVWKSPANRLHLRQRCSGNGRPRDTVEVEVTGAEFVEAVNKDKVCRCLRQSNTGLRLVKEARS